MATWKEEKMRQYEEEERRQRDTYDHEAGDRMAVKPPYGSLHDSLRASGPVPAPAADRLAQLGKELAEAAAKLQDARIRADESRSTLSHCEVVFAQVSEAIVKTIHEHREGTPEGVRYPS